MAGVEYVWNCCTCGSIVGLLSIDLSCHNCGHLCCSGCLTEKVSSCNTPSRTVRWSPGDPYGRNERHQVSSTFPDDEEPDEKPEEGCNKGLTDELNDGPGDQPSASVPIAKAGSLPGTPLENLPRVDHKRDASVLGRSSYIVNDPSGLYNTQEPKATISMFSKIPEAKVRSMPLSVLLTFVRNGLAVHQRFWDLLPPLKLLFHDDQDAFKQSLIQAVEEYADGLIRIAANDDEKTISSTIYQYSYVVVEAILDMSRGETSGNEQGHIDFIEDTLAAKANSTVILEVRDDLDLAFLRFESSMDFLINTLENILQTSPLEPKLLRGLLSEIWGDIPVVPKAILNISRSLTTARPDSISLRSFRPSYFYHVQKYLEWLTKSPWDWWPFLNPPQDDYSTLGQMTLLEWSCGCDRRQTALVPSVFAMGIRKILHRPNAAPTQQSIGVLNQNTVSTQQNPGALNQNTEYSFGSMASSSTTQDPGQVGHSIFGAVGGVPGRNQLDSFIRDRFVFLVAGPSQRLAQIQVHKVGAGYFEVMGDDDFFEALRSKYNSIRGLWPRIFSIWIYSHCEFEKFEKVHDNLITPRGEGYPSRDNINYEFEPRPPDSEFNSLAITPKEFEHRFYECFRGGQRHKHYVSRSCCKPCITSQEALMRIPKRHRQIEIGSREREIFWGLQAVEQICFMMVLLYHILFLIGPFVFWWLWLFWWGHQDDLQNASVPLLSAFGLLSLFWFNNPRSRTVEMSGISNR